MPRVIGLSNLPITERFYADFLEDGLPAKLSVDSFDRWCAANGLNDLKRDRNTILTRRNLAKSKINACACSEAWTADNPPFHISVETYGVSYTVNLAEDAYDRQCRRLPSQVQSLVMTKRRALKDLVKNVDLTGLPAAERVLVVQMEGELDELTEQIGFQVSRTSKRFERLQDAIAKLEAKNLLPQSADISKFLAVNGDAGHDEPGADNV